MNGLHRIFICVALVPELQQSIAEMERSLDDAGAKLRWTKPANLHFTLRFLGEIPLAQVAKAKVATREAALGVQPFSITLASVGAFPSVQRPRVVWVGVGEGHESMQLLADRLDDRLAHYRFPIERREFQAHLTLARVRDAQEWANVVRAIGQFKDVVVGSQRVDSMAVVESQLSPRGPTYTQVEEVRLEPYEK